MNVVKLPAEHGLCIDRFVQQRLAGPSSSVKFFTTNLGHNIYYPQNENHCLVFIFRKNSFNNRPNQYSVAPIKGARLSNYYQNNKNSSNNFKLWTIASVEASRLNLCEFS